MTMLHRRPAVAGTFYPAIPNDLVADIALRMSQAAHRSITPKALIVPHAGYMYSGAVAAHAYATLQSRRATIRHVVLLGPTHRVPVRGLAVPSVPAFDTPLGSVLIDRAAVDQALRLPQVVINDAAHAAEHSLEVHLPFLQSVLDNFSIVPFAVGDASAEEVAEVLDLIWGGDETIVLISSDLSHFHAYDEACQLDRSTADLILKLDALSSHQQACGATPINGLLVAARKHGLLPQLLDMRNSGDTAGDKSRVVGYASFAFSESHADIGTALLKRARNAIAAKLGLPAQSEPTHPELSAPGATFVTLTKNGQLRGCIGSLSAHRNLEPDVRANALAAAFGDPRFKPVVAEEWPQIRIEVSLLDAATPMTVADEADALRQLQPGVDGLIFECQGRRSTFLPQVWESLPEPRMFLTRLKEKAGLPGDFWATDVRLSRYTVQKWKEPH